MWYSVSAVSYRYFLIPKECIANILSCSSGGREPNFGNHRSGPTRIESVKLQLQYRHDVRPIVSNASHNAELLQTYFVGEQRDLWFQLTRISPCRDTKFFPIKVANWFRGAFSCRQAMKKPTSRHRNKKETRGARFNSVLILSSLKEQLKSNADKSGRCLKPFWVGDESFRCPRGLCHRFRFTITLLGYVNSL